MADNERQLTISCAMYEQKTFAFEVSRLGGHVRYLQ